MKLFSRKNDTGISRSELSDVLDQHAKDLIAGNEAPDALLAQHPDADPNALRHLFSLGRGTYRVLSAARVEPSRDFVEDLKSKLMQEEAYHDASAERWRGRQAWASDRGMALGSIVAILAAVAVLVHVVGTIVLLVAFIIGLGRNKQHEEVPTTSTP